MAIQRACDHCCVLAKLLLPRSMITSYRSSVAAKMRGAISWIQLQRDISAVWRTVSRWDTRYYCHLPHSALSIIISAIVTSYRLLTGRCKICTGAHWLSCFGCFHHQRLRRADR